MMNTKISDNKPVQWLKEILFTDTNDGSALYYMGEIEMYFVELETGNLDIKNVVDEMQYQRLMSCKSKESVRDWVAGINSYVLMHDHQDSESELISTYLNG